MPCLHGKFSTRHFLRKISDVLLENVVALHHSAVFCVARQEFPLVNGIKHGIAKLGIWPTLANCDDVAANDF